MASLQLSGLVSGFDWKSFVDQSIDLERTPATRMETEIANNQLKLTSLDGVESRINSLRDAVKALNSDGVFDARSASPSAAGWSAAASTNAAAGSYVFNFTQVATASRWDGAADIGSPLATSADVSGVTLANLGTAAAPTAGDFTVNGARITVALTDSLEDVFGKIATATNGDVTASYDPAQDRVNLTSSNGPVVLGSSTDSSNLLAVLRLNNNGTASVNSGARLGSASANSTLAGARLATAVTAVDGSGNGSFTLNGQNITYNVNTDSIASVVARINTSGAGVTAAYDPIEDRMSLVNSATGDLGFSLQESAGGLLGALGLSASAGGTLTRGQNAQFTVNGGSTITSASNVLTAASHGITGLTVTPPATGGSSTITVGADATAMRSKIDTFVTAFNSLQSYIDSQTKVTSSNGKVTTSTLSDNREIQNWTSQLRSAVFATVPGLSATMSRLENLGIDFAGTETKLVVKDSTKLDNALRDRPSEVGALFRQAGTGLSARLESLFTSYVGQFGGAGLLGGQRSNITASNTSLTQQIADLDRRLVQRREQMQAGFIAMETAQSLIQQMQTQLTSAFPTNSSSSKK